jgi:hypothetical protein
MNASALKIHQALEVVATLRAQRAADPVLAAASNEVKRFQAIRFQATYGDLLKSPRYQPATQFFLSELYGDKNYTDRDEQFARIASTIANLFPQAVANTAAALADVHAFTEQLDNDMAHQWSAMKLQPASSTAARYIACWRKVADPAARQKQLDVVLALGRSLNDLTRKPGLRTLLKMMRGPAAAAGLGSLQKFLESGFDAFAAMQGADEFLALISRRESEWIASLFTDDAVACETKLNDSIAEFNGR